MIELASSRLAASPQSTAQEVLRWSLGEGFAGRLAVVSSFGADSAVLLHMVAEIDASVPILFVDTGRHFAETLAYRDTLARHLGLRDLRTVAPSRDEIARKDADGSRAEWDPDGCCAFRKVAPLDRALTAFDAWITGRKRYQGTRGDLAVLERDGRHVKINPLVGWSAGELADYADRHRLPAHPLVAGGFPSIGCAPCTSRVCTGEDSRAGRWRGFAKVECGIHRRARSSAPA